MGPPLTNDQHLTNLETLCLASLLTLAAVMALAQCIVRGTCATLIGALAAHICQLHGPLGRIHFAPVLLPNTYAPPCRPYHASFPRLNMNLHLCISFGKNQTPRDNSLLWGWWSQCKIRTRLFHVKTCSTALILIKLQFRVTLGKGSKTPVTEKFR